MSKRPLVVAGIPHVQKREIVERQGVRRVFDQAHAQNSAPAAEAQIDAAPITRDWLRVSSGLLISAALLYLALHSLTAVGRIQQTVDTPTPTDSVRVANTNGSRSALRAPSLTPVELSTAPQMSEPPASGSIANSIQDAGQLLSPDESISDPLESLPNLPDGLPQAPGGFDNQHLEITPQANSVPPLSVGQELSILAPNNEAPTEDAESSSEYPGTGYPALPADELAADSSPLMPLNASDRVARLPESGRVSELEQLRAPIESTTPDLRVRLQGTIEKFPN